MEGWELPVGWAMATVGELTNVGPKNETADETEVGFVPLQRLGVTYLSRHTHEPRVWKEVKKGYTQFQNGDVLLARITPSFENGKAGIARDLPNGLGAGSTEYIVFRPFADALDPRYLLAHFKTRSFLTSGEMVMTGAVGQQRVPKAFVLESQLPLAPLNEQRRIAAKLDTTLAAVDACRQRLDGVAAILKRFRQAVLSAATSGELTREWREENADANQWGSTTFGAECHYITVGFVGKMADQYVAHGVPFLRSLNVRPFRFDRENLAFISPVFHQSIIKSSLLPGDLAVVRTGAPGQCCVIPDELPEANCSDLVIARPGPRLIADFGAIVINSSLGQGFVKSEQVGVAQAHFNVGSMKRAPLYLPSIAEQKEIVRRAQGLFTLANQLETRLNTARKLVDRLTPALLAKAFRGELVPQDPGDEPASVLLERIRAARQVEAAAGKPSRRGRRKAATNPDQIAMDAAPVPLDFLAGLLRECGALSERALLAVSELEPQRFQQQLYRELESGTAREVQDNGQVLLEAVG